MARKKLPKLNKKKIAALSNDMASSEQPEVDSKPVVGVVNSSNTHQRRPIAIIIIAVLLIAAAIGWYVISMKDTEQATVKLTPPDMSTSFMRETYAMMTEDQVQNEMQKKWNVDMRALDKTPLQASSFTSFDQVYATAQAFSGLQKFPKSIEAFAIAEQKAPKNVSYQFYIDYANCVESVDNPDQAKVLQLLQKALKNLETDKKIAASVKEVAVPELKDRIRLTAE